MGAFLERYGISIFVIIIIGIMVLMASPLGLKVEDLVKKEINNFTTVAQGESWENGDNEEPVTLIGEAYAVYSEDDNSLTFMRSETKPVVGDSYNGKTITKVYSDFENGYEVAPQWYWDLCGYGTWFLIEKVSFDNVIRPTSCQDFFAGMSDCTKIDLTNLDLSNTTNASSMFDSTCSNVESFEIIGINNLNVSNITDMYRMFASTGRSSKAFDLDLSKWDVSNVTNMEEMFLNTGKNATIWSIGDLSNWDVSNVTNMNALFDKAGYNANIFNTGNLNNWNTSNVTNMQYMFCEAGYNATKWNVGDLSTKTITANGKTYTAWDVSNVTDIQYMFCYAAYNASEWNIGDITNWNTSNVEYMNNVFESAGQNADYYLNFRDKWSYSKAKTKNSFDYNVDSKVRCPWE